jgi:hypothetical protein
MILFAEYDLQPLEHRCSFRRIVPRCTILVIQPLRSDGRKWFLPLYREPNEVIARCAKDPHAWWGIRPSGQQTTTALVCRLPVCMSFSELWACASGASKEEHERRRSCLCKELDESISVLAADLKH